MANITLSPYLFFQGNCREAMEFYKGIFGGELSLQTRGEVDPSAPDDMKDKIIHAKLEGEVAFMSSDNMDSSVLGKGKICLSLNGLDESKLRTMFEKLSDGGKVNYPLKTEFWGDTFGTLTDKFDVDWMINIEAKKE